MALADNIVSYWKLDESSGDAADSVASNTLANIGTATYAAAKINNGVALNGSSQLLKVVDASQTGLDLANAFTISGWFNFSSYSSTTFYGLVCKVDYGDAGTARAYAFMKNNGTNTLDLYTGHGGAGAGNTSVSWTPSTSTWYHVAVTRNGTMVRFYVNGSQQGADQTAASAGAMYNSARAFRIGAGADGAVDATFYYFPGSIDEVGVWSRDLSASEIGELYNGGSGLQYPFTATANTGFFNLM